MNTATLRTLLLVAAFLGLAKPAARAGFHLIEVEQVVAGLNGEPTALAIQLRLRSSGQTLFGSVAAVRIRLWDSTGANPITIGSISSNFGSGTLGSRILFTSPAFNAAMASVPGFSSDFTLSNVPSTATYLAAGKITFEQTSNGSVLWSLAWGGSGYTGTNTGLTVAGGGNDTDGNYGAPFGSALVTTGRGLLYQNGTNASTANSTDYTFTSGVATLTKNSGTSFVVVPEPGTAALLAVGALALGRLAWSRRRSPR